MANEITYKVSLFFEKGNIPRTGDSSGDKLATLSGDDYEFRTQLVGTSEEALHVGDVGTPGMCLMQNLDDTNFVSVRAATGAANTVELKPGEWSLFRLARTATAPYVIANTANVRIRYLLLED